MAHPLLRSRCLVCGVEVRAVVRNQSDQATEVSAHAVGAGVVEEDVRTVALAALVALGLSGCSRGQKVKPAEESVREYVIGREDVLDVSVWRDGDLSRTIPVRPDGMISLPLVGELQAEGKTAPALSKEISEKLSPYVQDPRVVVIVREVNAPRFFVIGEVIRPGAYPLRSRTSLLQALSLAGGFNEFADRSSIVVVRGEKERLEIDYDDLLEADSAADIGLRPGDTIYVP